MPTALLRELQGRNFFHDAELPLKIFMHEYKSHTDRWHRHQDFYELVVICSGHACNENEASATMVQAGDVYLFPAGSVHRYRQIQHFWHYNLLFDPAILTPNLPYLMQLPGYQLLFHFPPRPASDACSQVLSVDESVLARLISQIEQIRNELALQTPGWQAGAYFGFLHFLAYLLRNCVPQRLQLDTNIQQISRVIRMTEEDCRKPYSLLELAKEAHMSVSSFRHHFTAITGVSPGDYLIKLRIKKALLLLCSSSSITRVAGQVGFHDSNYFARQFRRQNGMTPREFQKKYQVNPNILEEVMEQLLPENSLRLQIRNSSPLFPDPAVPISR
ncbi:MAG: AraC family transcriptional regulator [Lentisphaeria bacterium]